MHIPILVCSPGAPCEQIRPVTFGVPIPKRSVTAETAWRLALGSGRSCRVETTVLDQWPDGSVRWLLVDAALSGALPPRITLETTEDGPLDRRVLVTMVDGGCDVDTGVASFRFREGGAFPFDSADCSGVAAIDANLPIRGLVLTGANGTIAMATVGRVTVDHHGRTRVSILCTATVVLEGRRLVVETRTDLFADSATIRLRCTIRNPDCARHPGNFWDLGDPGSVLLRDASFVVALPTGPLPQVHFSAETGQPWTTTIGPFELYQDSSGGEHWCSSNHLNRRREVPTTFRGYRLRTDAGESTALRATPAVRLDSGERQVGVVVPQFWQNCPKAIEVDGSCLTVRLFPAQYADAHELQGGEQKTHELIVTLEPGADASALLDWWRQPDRLTAAPEWHLAAGAVDFLAPLDPDHLRLVDQAIDGDSSFEVKREVIDQYGWRNFGEIYGDHEAIGHTGPQPLVSHYNNQYDPVLGFGLQFLRSGDARWWSAMDELAAHVIDIDIYHTTRDKAAYNGGLFWHTYHYGDADTATHRTYPRRNTGTVSGGGPSADHNYPTGLALHHFLTGDARSREAAIGLAEYVLNLDDGRLSPFRFLSHADTGLAIITRPDYFGPSRASGNSLNALVDGHRLTGDVCFLEKADALVARVIHPDDDPHAARLDEPEHRWFYAMFLQALGRYLRHKAEIGQLDRFYAHGRSSLLTYARWMCAHEYPYLTRPEKLEHPTETWAAQDIRKVDIFCYAAMHASDEEREAFLERAAFFHRTSVDTLLGMPTRALARPVIVLLTSGALLEWWKAHPGSAAPAPGSTERIPRVAFVPQRRIAERRARVIAVAGAILAAGVLVVSIVW